MNQKIHFPVIDFHVDSIIQQRLFGYRVTRRHKARKKGQRFIWHADVPRMLDAKYAGACLGIHYYPFETAAAWYEMLQQIEYLDGSISEHEKVLRVRQKSDWAKAIEDGKLALSPGVEGAHMLNGDIDRVLELKALNISYLTLAHFSKNSAATPSLGRGANEQDRLSDFGVDLVAALDEADITIDLAHVNTPGVLHAASLSKKALFCTHTGVKGAHDHARNLNDEEMDAIKESNGVIGIMFATNFLAGGKANSDRIVDHVEYVIDKLGYQHVGIGSDFDGWVPIPQDMADCVDVHNIAEILKKRGYEDEVIEAVMWKNGFEMLSGLRDALSDEEE